MDPKPVIDTPSPSDGFGIDPIGVIRTPFADKASAPRQPSLSHGASGVVELFSGRGYEDALDGVETFDTLWLLFRFHMNDGWRPKVQPPRSATKRGVFATRSPHRPNGIGMSVVRLERVDGLHLHVVGVDMVDGTPLLDIKPYLPYTDAVPNASSGWLEAPRDPGPRYGVVWTESAEAELAWLRGRGLDLRAGVETLLSTGPEPHAYRRIRVAEDGGRVLAVKSWRFSFIVRERTVTIARIFSGYRPAELAAPHPREDVELALHRAFADTFGGSGAR